MNTRQMLTRMWPRSFPGVKENAYDKVVVLDAAGFGVRGAKYQIIRFRPRDSIGEHAHHHCTELYLVESGAAIIHHNGKDKRLAKGDILLLRAGDRHAIHNPFRAPFIIHLFKWNEVSGDILWTTPPPAPRSPSPSGGRAR